VNYSLYKPWMHDQIINLFVAQYNVGFDEFATKFKEFYFHPYQQNKAIMLVALEGETVAGFQSFFHWPMEFEKKRLNVYQSGNSIINPDFRGQRLFNKLLQQIHLGEQYDSIDFLMGFPVVASYKSFIRDEWLNPFDLEWYVKIINPVAGVFSANSDFADPPELTNYVQNGKFLKTNYNSEFNAWRANFSDPKHYFRPKQFENILLEFKVTKRKRFINELTIGNFYGDPMQLKGALNELTGYAFRKFNVTIVSMAISANNYEIIECLKSSGFKKINKAIHFIYKPMKINPQEQYGNWMLTRGDIDTW